MGIYYQKHLFLRPFNLLTLLNYWRTGFFFEGIIFIGFGTIFSPVLILNDWISKGRKTIFPWVFYWFIIVTAFVSDLLPQYFLHMFYPSYLTIPFA